MLEAGLPDSAREAFAASVLLRPSSPFAPLVDGGTAATRGDDMLRASEQLQDIHASTIAVDDVDQAAIVDLEVVGHVAARVARVGVGFRNVEGYLRRGVRLADVPDAQAAVEIRNSRQLALYWVGEVLLGGVDTEARDSVRKTEALTWVGCASC